MKDEEYRVALVKIILTLQNQKHGCKEEAINIAMEALGSEIEHNPIREMINSIKDEDVKRLVTSLNE